jgi:hypothetical protein
MNNLGQSCGSKLKMDDGDKDLFKRGLYMNVVIMWRARSGQPSVTSGTFERCGIRSGGGF